MHPCVKLSWEGGAHLFLAFYLVPAHWPWSVVFSARWTHATLGYICGSERIILWLHENRHVLYNVMSLVIPMGYYLFLIDFVQLNMENGKVVLIPSWDVYVTRALVAARDIIFAVIPFELRRDVYWESVGTHIQAHPTMALLQSTEQQAADLVDCLTRWNCTLWSQGFVSSLAW